jgi:hypothetical protein
MQQVPSLLCNLKDILLGNGQTQNMRKFIKEIIFLLEKYNKFNSY